MNKEIMLVSDSACNLTKTDCEELNVQIVPFLISLDGIEYAKEDYSFDIYGFYKTLVENPKLKPKSACPQIGDYQKLFERAYENNQDVICICLTSKFSTSYNAACVARDMVYEENDNKIKIEVVDSLSITHAQGMLVRQVSSMIKEGMKFEEIIEKIEEIKKTSRVFFTTNDVEYLSRGGRIGKLALSIVDKVNIKPIIYFKDGDITIPTVAIGRNRSLMKVKEKIKQYFSNNKHNINDYMFCVGYGYDNEEGKKFYDSLISMLKDFALNIEIKLRIISATIGVHTGPGPIGLCIIKKYNC